MSSSPCKTDYINQKLIRVDDGVNKKLIVDDRLRCGYTKIIADAFLALDNLYGVSIFFRYMKPADPTKGFGYQMIGTGFPRGEKKLKVGDHLIARIHEQFPITKKAFMNHFAVRQTYTKDLWFFESIGDPTEFVSLQLKAFGGSINNFLGFMMYYLLRNLSGCCTKGQQCQPCPSSGQACCKSTEIEEYENYCCCVFSDSAEKVNGSVPFYGEGLSLEELPQFCGPRQVSVNDLKAHLDSLRRRLKTNCVSYNPASCFLPQDLNPHVQKTLALKSKIKEIVREIARNGGKYKIDKTGQFNMAPHMVNPSQDLVVLMNPEDQATIDEGYPLILKTSGATGFTAEDLGVNRVLFVPYVVKGEAYVFHKDVLQMIITEQEIDSFDYREHRCTNIWARLGFTIDLIDMLPAVVIKCGAEGECTLAPCCPPSEA